MSSATRSSSRRPQRNRKPVESIYTQAERELRESVGSSNTNRSSTGSITTSNSRRSPSRNQSDGNRSRRNVVSRSRASRSPEKSESRKRRKLSSKDSLFSDDDELESEMEEQEQPDVVEKNEEVIEDEDNQDEHMMSSSSESADSDSDDDEVIKELQEKNRQNKRNSPAKTTPVKTNARTTRKKVVQIQDPRDDYENDENSYPPSAAKRNRKHASSHTIATTYTRRQVQTAMMAIAKKVLSDEETPESSLTAALLYSCKNAGDNNRRPKNQKSVEFDDLAEISRKLAERLQNNDNNADRHDAEIDLLNLILRSVGCRYEHLLKHDNVELDEISDDELAEVIQQVVDDMAETANDSILLCADPHGASLAGRGGNVVSILQRPKVAALEYRRIYQEFWYQLGAAIVSNNRDIAEIGTKNEGNATSSVDVARDLISRLMEFVWVGVPDIRAAVSIAIYQIASSLLHCSVQWLKKLQVAQRQYQSAKRLSSSSRKAKALQQQVEFLNMSIKAAEEIVKESVMAVFLKRYRDKNEHIRSESLRALSSFTLLRPDLFLNGMYLKYFGWLLSDKEAIVRQSAVNGLLAPFRENQRKEDEANKTSSNKTSQQGSDSNDVEGLIDTSGMSNVIQKFLTRLADCAIDVDFGVQEVAMELLLHLVRNDFFDSVDNDNVWQQINLRAIEPETTPAVRRYALYFVMEQLQQFDTGSSDSDSDAVERIKALVEWISHVLADSDIPVEFIRYEMTDFLVASLRSMPEHQSLCRNWSAILQSLQDDSQSNSNKKAGRKSIGKGDQRQDAVQQRVILRFLVSSAEFEARFLGDSNSANHIEVDVDSDLLEIQKSGMDTVVEATTRKDKERTSTSKEELTLALLRALPDLLVSFKSETPVLQNLTSLPRYLLPSVFNLPSKKKDFHALNSTISSLFLEATDETVLSNCALALVSLTRGDHARRDEALLILKKTAGSLKSRLSEILEERAELSLSTNEDKNQQRPVGDDGNDSSLIYAERSLNLCLCRLRILSKRWYLPDLLSDASDEEEDEILEDLFKTVSDHFTKELSVRQLLLSQENFDDVEIPKVWTTVDEKVHAVVAESISDALDLLLSITAWKLLSTIQSLKNSDDTELDKETGDPDGREVDDHLLLRMRNQMIKLVVLCYEQFVEPEHYKQVTECQLKFSISLQEHAGRLTGDLRMLFPKSWCSAKSQLLSSLALTQEVHLVGGLVRFVRSQEEKLRQGQGGSDNSEAVHRLLLPLARGLAGNWLNGNRKEAGVALAHISGSGKDAHNLVQSLSRVCKKLHPVRLLESHMAYLRQDFNDWKASQPEELESDRPTDDELAEFEKAEKAHKAKFEAIENRAARLSASLGVGSIRDKTLAPALVGFVREGIRFSFSTATEGSDEAVLPGDRLTFLLPLSKFLNWIRPNKGASELLKQYLNNSESDLRNDPDYRDMFEEDKAAIESFRKTAGFGSFIGADNDDEAGNSTSSTNLDSATHANTVSTAITQSNVESNTAVMRPSARSAVSTRLTSVGASGSVSSASIRSKYSSSQSLSPLREEDEEDVFNNDGKDDTRAGLTKDVDDISQLSPSPRRSNGRQVGTTINQASVMSVATLEHSAGSIDEACDESNEY